MMTTTVAGTVMVRSVRGSFAMAVRLCAKCDCRVEDGCECPNPACTGFGECAGCGKRTPSDVLFVTESSRPDEYTCDLCLTGEDDAAVMAGVLKSVAEVWG